MYCYLDELVNDNVKIVVRYLVMLQLMHLYKVWLYFRSITQIPSMRDRELLPQWTVLPAPLHKYIFPAVTCSFMMVS